MDLKNFGVTVDPTTLPEPENKFDALPNGDYLAHIEKAEIKQSQKSTNNYYINVQFSIDDARYQNRKVFEIINFKNDNEVAERIGMSRLGELMRSINTNSTDVETWIGSPLYITLKQSKDLNGNPSNAVSKSKAIESKMPSSVQSSAPAHGKPSFFNKK